MTVETKEGLWGMFDGIAESLKELMDKVTWWLNDLLVKLWLKKEAETQETTEASKKELIELEVWIKIADNTKYKELVSWLEDVYDEDVVVIIKENLENEIVENAEEITDIDQKIVDIVKVAQDNLELIEKDEGLEEIVNTIYEDKEIEEKYSINEIALAYETLNIGEEEITKEEILEQMES